MKLTVFRWEFLLLKEYDKRNTSVFLQTLAYTMIYSPNNTYVQIKSSRKCFWTLCTKYVYKVYRYADNTSYNNVGLLIYKLLY